MKDTLRNTKEIRTILSILFYLNRLGHNDKDITKLLDYAFRRIFNNNTNLLVLACVGRDKENAMPEILEILKNETKYNDYLEGKQI